VNGELADAGQLAANTQYFVCQSATVNSGLLFGEFDQDLVPYGGGDQLLALLFFLQYLLINTVGRLLRAESLVILLKGVTDLLNSGRSCSVIRRAVERIKGFYDVL